MTYTNFVWSSTSKKYLKVILQFAKKVKILCKNITLVKVKLTHKNSAEVKLFKYLILSELNVLFLAIYVLHV